MKLFRIVRRMAKCMPKDKRIPSVSMKCCDKVRNQAVNVGAFPMPLRSEWEMEERVAVQNQAEEHVLSWKKMVARRRSHASSLQSSRGPLRDQAFRH